MKTKIFLLTGILGIALAGVIFTGCKKDSTATAADTDYAAAQDDANASDAANDSKNVSDAAMVSNSGHSAYHSATGFSSYYGGATITWAHDSVPGDTIYINFGTTPVLCGDLRYRSGEIIVYWPVGAATSIWKAYNDSGVTVTQKFVSYSVGYTVNNMHTVSGTRTWTNEGTSALTGYQNWNFTANLTLTYPSGQTATWNSARNNTIAEVGTTWYYVVTGTYGAGGEAAAGVSKSGIAYTISITSPLYATVLPWWAGGCAWIESGDISISRVGKPNALTVNMGTLGDCSNTAVATLNGVNYYITK